MKIFLKENYISKKDCNLFINSWEKNKKLSKEGIIKITDISNRVKEIELIQKYFNKNLLKEISSYFNDFELKFGPFSLRKLVENHAILPHNDEKDSYIDLKRKYSMITYLNENFNGGLLHLLNLKIKIKPSIGLLVCFPGVRDTDYLHEVTLITKNNRYTISSHPMYL